MGIIHVPDHKDEGRTEDGRKKDMPMQMEFNLRME